MQATRVWGVYECAHLSVRVFFCHTERNKIQFTMKNNDNQTKSGSNTWNEPIKSVPLA